MEQEANTMDRPVVLPPWSDSMVKYAKAIEARGDLVTWRSLVEESGLGVHIIRPWVTRIAEAEPERWPWPMDGLPIRLQSKPKPKPRPKIRFKAKAAEQKPRKAKPAARKKELGPVLLETIREARQQKERCEIEDRQAIALALGVPIHLLRGRVAKIRRLDRNAWPWEIKQGSP